NRRTDHWGGTLEKRMNFPLEVIEAAKKAIQTYAEKPFIFGYRISPEELEEPGITLQDTLAFLDKLKDTGLDYIHISTGSAFQSSMRDKSDQTPILQLIHEKIGDSIPLIGVGSVKTPEDATAVLDMGIPIVALGRELIVDPDWADKVSSGKEDTIRKTISYSDQQELVIPDAMWEYIQLAPGWLPFERTND
ncbi:MAG: NADH-dependent flavin oxidoreductase, partial [Desemzia incerta]